MVTGPAGHAQHVWKSYGVSISVNPKTGLEAHNDVMDFIDPQGFLRYRATPFADESSHGDLQPPRRPAARWGQGIATYARTALEPMSDRRRARRRRRPPIWQRHRGLLIAARGRS